MEALERPRRHIKILHSWALDHTAKHYLEGPWTLNPGNFSLKKFEASGNKKFLRKPTVAS